MPGWLQHTPATPLGGCIARLWTSARMASLAHLRGPMKWLPGHAIAQLDPAEMQRCCTALFAPPA